MGKRPSQKTHSRGAPENDTLTRGRYKALTKEEEASKSKLAEIRFRGATEQIAKGVRVRRGRDWMWDNQDGGAGRQGTVVRAEKAENWWQVKWDSGNTNSYPFGADGKFGLAIVQDGSGNSRKLATPAPTPGIRRIRQPSTSTSTHAPRRPSSTMDRTDPRRRPPLQRKAHYGHHEPRSARRKMSPPANRPSQVVTSGHQMLSNRGVQPLQWHRPTGDGARTYRRPSPPRVKILVKNRRPTQGLTPLVGFTPRAEDLNPAAPAFEPESAQPRPQTFTNLDPPSWIGKANATSDAPIGCQGGHELTPAHGTADSPQAYYCAVCKKKITGGMYECTICNWRACKDCKRTYDFVGNWNCIVNEGYGSDHTPKRFAMRLFRTHGIYSGDMEGTLEIISSRGGRIQFVWKNITWKGGRGHWQLSEDGDSMTGQYYVVDHRWTPHWTSWSCQRARGQDEESLKVRQRVGQTIKTLKVQHEEESLKERQHEESAKKLFQRSVNETLVEEKAAPDSVVSHSTHKQRTPKPAKT